VAKGKGTGMGRGRGEETPARSPPGRWVKRSDAGPPWWTSCSWTPGARALGGTGTSFPWEALEALDALRAQSPPGFRLGVAGGLDPGNVAEAIRRLRPDLVDVSSGVEAGPGVKDPARIRDFLWAVDQTRG